MSVEDFLDANVLVYAVSKAPEEAAKKRRALELIDQSDFGVSAQVMQEFYVTVTRKLKKPIPPSEALVFLESLSAFALVPVDFPLIQRAIFFSQRYQITYWDGAIVAAAERVSATTLYTEDLNHEQTYGSVKVINPFLDLPQ